ncbi:hypothetical protein RclHR1_05680014 [Rhizophagus clarus]|nr:hypothetical protein RclHR1_05680014 [Rhizophagus clarus]
MLKSKSDWSEEFNTTYIYSHNEYESSQRYYSQQTLNSFKYQQQQQQSITRASSQLESSNWSNNQEIQSNQHSPTLPPLRNVQLNIEPAFGVFNEL